VRQDTTEIESGADAERALADRGIHAELGTALDNDPAFLRAAASATIDAHERYPVLREGAWPLQGVYAVTALPEDDELRVDFEENSDGVLAANALGQGRHVVLLNDSTPTRRRELGQLDHAGVQPGVFVPAQRTSYGLVMHEMGHSTARAEFGVYGDDLIGASAIDAGFESFDDVERVSMYSTVSPHEFFAEAFAQRNSPEGWGVFDDATQQRLERFAVIINAGRRVL
jgi:hypothetical protein